MKPQILLVEDTEELLVALMTFLEIEGYEVFTARNGNEAFSILTEHNVDLIISDIMMPKMGGFEFIEKLTRISSKGHLAIILMSSKSDSNVENLASELQVDAFLEKPFELSTLLFTVKSILRKKKA